MTEEHKQKIQKNFQVLVEELDVHSLLDYLLQECIITYDQFEEITVEKVRAKQARKLLLLLFTRGDGAYRALTAGLRTVCRQDWLANRIETTQPDL